eukprot:8386869-Pyramimonas_sp.AAC.1
MRLELYFLCSGNLIRGLSAKSHWKQASAYHTKRCDSLSANQCAMCLKTFASSYRWVKRDVHVRCYTAEHSAYQTLAGAGILLYPLGIPLLFYGIMLRY